MLQGQNRLAPTLGLSWYGTQYITFRYLVMLTHNWMLKSLELRFVLRTIRYHTGFQRLCSLLEIEILFLKTRQILRMFRKIQHVYSGRLALVTGQCLIWRKCVLTEFPKLRLGELIMTIFPTKCGIKGLEAKGITLPIYLKFDVIFSSTWKWRAVF